MELGVAREHPVHMMDVAATPSCKQDWRMRLAGSVVSAGERHICSHTRGHFQHTLGTLSVGTRCFCSRTRQLRQHARSTLMTDAKCICSWLETHYQHTRSMPQVCANGSDNVRFLQARQQRTHHKGLAAHPKYHNDAKFVLF